MSAAKHTPGPWQMKVNGSSCVALGPSGGLIARLLKTHHTELTQIANARLIAAAPDQHAEMLRYLPVLERAEADPDLWSRLTDGLGIATLNGYRAAIAKATGSAA